MYVANCMYNDCNICIGAPSSQDNESAEERKSVKHLTRKFSVSLICTLAKYHIHCVHTTDKSLFHMCDDNVL